MTFNQIHRQMRFSISFNLFDNDHPNSLQKIHLFIHSFIKFIVRGFAILSHRRRTHICSANTRPLIEIEFNMFSFIFVFPFAWLQWHCTNYRNAIVLPIDGIYSCSPPLLKRWRVSTHRIRVRALEHYDILNRLVPWASHANNTRFTYSLVLSKHHL